MSDDATLFQAWRQGDRSAGDALIARELDALRRFVAGKVASHADDLVQRTLLACAEATHAYRGESTFRAFLFGIARNVLHEHFRSQARHGSAPLDFSQSSIMDIAPGVATITHKRAEQRVLVVALKRLPMDLQLMLELYYWEEMGIDELALELGVPPGTVKSRLHRARGLLAELIPAVEATPEETQSARAVLDTWSARAEP